MRPAHGARPRLQPMSGGATGYVGIDIGTYGSKGVLIAHDGEVVATATREHGMDTPRPGWAEHDADEVWWSDLCEIARELVAADVEAGVGIGGLGVSAIGPTCLPIDDAGRPLRPSILYGIDTRATREIEELEAELGAERILEVAGSPLTAQAVGPKVRWIQRHEPDVWDRTRYVLTASSYLVSRLTGRYVVDAYSAAAQAPFFDLHAGGWAAKFVDTICSVEQLPEIVRSTEVVGELTTGASEATGIPAGTPVAAGTIDAAAEAVAAGLRAPGDMMVMYGTTAFFIQVIEEPIVSPRLWGGVWVDGEHAVLTGGMSTTGAITQWLRRELSDFESSGEAFDRLFEEADASVPGANGLLVLPYWSGERTPINEPHARGVIAGLSMKSTRGDLLRAVLEATGFGVRHHLEAMAEAGANPSRLVAIGGGARSHTWLQAVSDATGRVQEVPRERAGAAYGDALLAAVATGAIDDLDAAAELVEVEERIEPTDAHRELYDRRYRTYRDLFVATRDAILELQEQQL